VLREAPSGIAGSDAEEAEVPGSDPYGLLEREGAPGAEGLEHGRAPGSPGSSSGRFG